MTAPREYYETLADALAALDDPDATLVLHDEDCEIDDDNPDLCTCTPTIVRGEVASA